VGRCLSWSFSGDLSWEVTNNQHALQINVTYDFNSIRVLIIDECCRHGMLPSRSLLPATIRATTAASNDSDTDSD